MLVTLSSGFLLLFWILLSPPKLDALKHIPIKINKAITNTKNVYATE